MMFRNPQALYLLLLVLLLVVAWVWRPGRIAFSTVLLRSLSVVLIVLALANPVLVQGETTNSTLVFLIDQSDSLGEDGKAQLRSAAQNLMTQAQQAGNSSHALLFGGTVASDSGDASQAQPQETDIAAALQAANGLIGSGSGQVILLSDGEQTRGDALPQAQALAARGIPIDIVPYSAALQPDVWVEQVSAPATLRVGESYTVDVTVGSTSDGSTLLRLFDGQSLIEERAVTVQALGSVTASFQLTAQQAGIAQLRAEVVAQPDGQAQNNSGATTALIAPPPRILLLEGSSASGDSLRMTLRQAGVDADLIPAASLPVELSQLDSYEGIVMLDVPASDLSTDQMATLREFVRSEGRGLVATGGRSSFTLGAYKGTPLEEVLPVEMTPPPRPERSEVTLLLIIDRSASMSVPETPSKFDMAKEAALLATEALEDGDRVGVLSFDTSQEWAVDFQVIGAGLSNTQIQEQIGQIGLGGGTDIFAALNTGLTALAAQPGDVRHAVLLTDGRSFTTTRTPYQNLLERARAQNITLSAIAVGSDADTELLQDLAQWGAGRYHFAAQPSDIPRLTLLESDIARTEPQVEGAFRAEQTTPHPLLREFPASTIPELGGYVATTVKPEAELVLQSPENDPVLAVWQYGLGRAVAWTPSISDPWAPNWLSWPEYGDFWAQIIRYTLPEPDAGPLQISTTRQGDTVTISAESITASGAPLDLATTSASITMPDGSSREITLLQTAPGIYAQTVRLPSDGAYAIAVQQQKDDLSRSALAGYVQPYSREYLPNLGDGARLLEQLRAAGDGRIIDQEMSLEAGSSTTTSTSTEFWPWLLLGALLLWPIEIAVRRGWLRWR